MEIAVLGCGPTGMLAAHAAYIHGIDPVIFSIKKKSKIGGAVYLHEPIHGITPLDPEAWVEFVKYGDVEGYAKKVYGSVEMADRVSWNEFQEGEDRPAWDMVGAYDRLWERYEGEVINGPVSKGAIENCIRIFDLVVSTIPLKYICYQKGSHFFRSQKIYVSSENPFGLEGNAIVYDGSEDHSFYRSSRFFGREASTEYSQAIVDSGFSRIPSDAVPVKKPISSDCDCWQSVKGIATVGRYGAWNKRWLTTDAYNIVHHILREIVV